MTEEEVKTMLKAKREKRIENYNKIYEELKARSEKEEVAKSPLLEDKILKLIAIEKSDLT